MEKEYRKLVRHFQNCSVPALECELCNAIDYIGTMIQDASDEMDTDQEYDK